MEEAKRMLAYTDLPVAEIAFELNYETVSYFSRCFRRYTEKLLWATGGDINHKSVFCLCF